MDMNTLEKRKALLIGTIQWMREQAALLAQPEPMVLAQLVDRKSAVDVGCARRTAVDNVKC